MNTFQKQIDAVKVEIDTNDSQEFAVTELIDLGKRISIKK